MAKETDLRRITETETDMNLLHNYTDPKPYKEKDEDRLPAPEGLANPKALIFVVCWYFFSAVTLFANKYILTTLKGEPTLLSTFQIVMTMILGYVQIHFPLGFYKDPPVRKDNKYKPKNFYKNMTIVGCTRFTVVFLGVVALKYVAVSFTETVKSTAPIFTVIISRLLLGEFTSIFVQCSLLPIMAGLALCSSYELSFNIPGFVSALAANLTECLQFVYLKLLLNDEKAKYTAAEIQFYTCVFSIFIQIPACIFLMDFTYAYETLDMTLLMAYIINGVSYHIQTMCGFVLIAFISPVTHSVVNTVKRAFLIWSSVLIFGNPVTLLSGLGTCVVFIGVFCYNKARAIEHRRKLAEPRQDLLEESGITHV